MCHDRKTVRGLRIPGRLISEWVEDWDNEGMCRDRKVWDLGVPGRPIKEWVEGWTPR